MVQRFKSILCVLFAALLLSTAGMTASATSAQTTEPTPESEAMVEVFGKQVSTDTRILDLNKIKLDSTQQVEQLLPLFPNLEKVEMCQCGIADEQMAALNDKYPDIQFVWEVTICTYFTMRTDVTFFMPTKMNIGHGEYLDFSNLKYCTDIELIDLGHYRVEDTDFLNYMPKLKYLIICDGILTDVTNIGNCTQLEFLEMFLNPLTDFAPLTNLTNLRDLNVSYTPFYKKAGVGYVYTDDFGDISPLLQMTWLDRLWMCNNRLEQDQLDLISDTLSHTDLEYISWSSTDRGWRHSPHYFAGRDIVGGGYMTK